MPHTDIVLSLADARFTGQDLERPECVLATRDGSLYVSDRRGGILRIAPDGGQRLFAPPGQEGQAPSLLPNGFALLRDGSFAIANLAESGGVWRLGRDGSIAPLLLEVEGRTLGSVNFVWLDAAERLWVSVSTVRVGDHQFRGDIADGFIILMDGSGARIVADGIGWTNECRIDAAGRHLYVNETFGRRLTRFRVAADGSLSGRETVTEFGAGTYPDGLAIDVEGCLWVVSVVSNRLIRVTPDGRQTVLLEDYDPAHVDALETAFRENRLSRPMVWDNHAAILGNTTSIAFAGEDLRTIHLGGLSGRRLATFRSPVAGLEPAHWTFG